MRNETGLRRWLPAVMAISLSIGCSGPPAASPDETQSSESDREAPRRGLEGPVELVHAEEDFHWAAARGEIGKVKASIQGGADVNERHPEHGRTPLEGAASFGHLETARVLIAAGADPNLAGEDTPIRAAAHGGDAEMVELLIEGGADVGTALISAASMPRSQLEYFGWPESDLVAVVETLLAAGADPNVAERGRTPLMAAASAGYSQVAAALVAGGADLDPTALTVAEAAGHADVVEVLLDAGATHAVEDTSLPTALEEERQRLLREMEALERPPDSEPDDGGSR